jgi:hypothetical protein
MKRCCEASAACPHPNLPPGGEGARQGAPCGVVFGFSPSPSGGGQGWGQAALDRALLQKQAPLAPIPTFPREGKEQGRERHGAWFSVFLPPLPGEGRGGGKRRSMKRCCEASTACPHPNLPPEGEGARQGAPRGVVLGFSPSPSGGGQGWGQAALDRALLQKQAPLAPIPTFPREGKEQDRERHGAWFLVFLPPLPGEGRGGGKRRSMKRCCEASAACPHPNLPPGGEGARQGAPRGVVFGFSPSPSGGGQGWGQAALDEALLQNKHRLPPSQPSLKEGRRKAEERTSSCNAETS